jgi:ribosome-binding protein aMBF1 (putative translation factor)
LAKGTQDARYQRLIDALAIARRSAGISQVELATKLSQRQQFVSKYESGERRLDAIEVIDIGRALGIDVPGLLEEVAGYK